MTPKNKRPSKAKDKAVSQSVRDCLEQYFTDLDGHDACDVYALVLGEVEPAILETVLDYTGGNQTRASEILGINRSTLRKKLKQYDIEL